MNQKNNKIELPVHKNDLSLSHSYLSDPSSPPSHKQRFHVNPLPSPPVNSEHPPSQKNTVSTLQNTVSMDTPQNTVSTLPKNSVSTPKNTLSTPENTVVALPENTIVALPENTLPTLPKNSVSTPENTISTPENTISTPENTIVALSPKEDVDKQINQDDYELDLSGSKTQEKKKGRMRGRKPKNTIESAKKEVGGETENKNFYRGKETPANNDIIDVSSVNSLAPDDKNSSLLEYTRENGENMSNNEKKQTMDVPAWAVKMVIDAWIKALNDLKEKGRYKGKIPDAFSAEVETNGSLFLKVVSLPEGIILVGNTSGCQCGGKCEWHGAEGNEDKTKKRSVEGEAAEEQDSKQVNVSMVAKRRKVITTEGGGVVLKKE